MHRRAPRNPLTEKIVNEESVCCMLPLMSGRKLVARVGSGPMKSAFHTYSHTDLNKQILHPAFVKLTIANRMKGCATRVLRASTMCRLWHMEGEQSLRCMCALHTWFLVSWQLNPLCVCSDQDQHQGRCPSMTTTMLWTPSTN